LKRYSLYDLETGILSGRTFNTDVAEPNAHAAALAANIPSGCGAVEGAHDHLSRRVDLDKVAVDRQAVLAAHMATVATMRTNYRPAIPGETFHEPAPPLFIGNVAHVVDFRPPQPSTDHFWNTDSKRWTLSASAQAAQEQRGHARARIAALVASQHDLVRKLILAPDELARTQLQAIDNEVAELREIMAA
jgi:hypothetical protein